MTKKEKVIRVVEALKDKYPDAKCSLTYSNVFQLLIATRLSAQCTDARVNMVTPELFKAYPTAEAMAKAPLENIENLIKTCGLYKTKAKDLISIAKDITDIYGGTVPDTIEELTKLSGVGRKTANLICGDIYGRPAIVTDTHFIRIMNRLGFVDTDNPLKVELEMKKIVPPDQSVGFCHRVVMYGREICTARNPRCNDCVLNDICKKRGL